MARARSKCFAVDLGASSVKVCELKQTSSGLQLTKFAHINLGIDPSMPPEEKEALKLEGISRALKAGGFKSKRVLFAVPGQSVFVRNRLLPPVQESRLDRIVQYEIQQQIPFPLSQIALDYQVIKRTETREFDVMMTAIKVDTVDSLAGVILDSKLRIDAVDVSPVATYNWLRFNEELSKEEGETTACVDIGASTTDIFIERNGEFRFTRSLTVAGNHITEAIKEALSVPYEEAERLKVTLGRAPLESEGPPDTSTQEGKVAAVIGEVLGRLAHEINRSFGFFRTQSGGSPAARVVLCGGSAALRNVEQFMVQRLEVPVTLAEPFKKLTLAPTAATAQAIPHLLPTCLGLALRSVQACPLEINLIPPRIVEAEKRKERSVYWALSFLTLVLIVMATVPITYEKHESMEKEKVRLEEEIARYNEYELERKALADQRDDFKLKYAKLNEMAGGIWTWLAPLEAVCTAVPRGVWLGEVRTIDFSKDAAQSSGGSSGSRRRGGPRGPGGPGGRRQMMSRGGRSQGRGGRGAARGRSGGGTGAIQKVNGLSISAYADTYDQIEEFRDALSASKTFSDVLLYTTNVSKVNKYSLRQTGGTATSFSGRSSMGGPSSRFGGGGRARGRRGGPGGRRPMGGRARSFAPGYSSAPVSEENLVYSFMIDVKLGGA
jgi:type IV pilus assembly protein PilM